MRQSNLGKPQPRQVRELVVVVCGTRHEVEGPQAAPSFPASAQTTVPHVRSHRTRSIQRYHPHCNELAIPDRTTAKRTRKTSNLSQLDATNFAWICIDVHVQVLRDRVVAKLAKLLSKWRTPVIQEGAEFCLEFFPRAVPDQRQCRPKFSISGSNLTIVLYEGSIFISTLLRGY